MNILVIDDDPLSLNGLKMALEQRGGHCCSAFQDPELAIHEYAAHPFDVVISDIRMPRLSGLDVLKTIRRANPLARVILMTGFRDDVTADTAEANGACAYFVKPLRTEKLLDTLEKIRKEICCSSSTR